MIAVLEIDKDVVAVLFQTLALVPRISKLLIIVFLVLVVNPYL